MTATAPRPAAVADALEEEAPPPGPRLSHDLLVHGLPAREASRLRDALARTGIPLDVDVDESSVLVPCESARPVSLANVLAILRAWAHTRGVSGLPVVYGANDYVLAVRSRSAQDAAEERPPAAGSAG